MLPARYDGVTIGRFLRLSCYQQETLGYCRSNDLGHINDLVSANSSESDDREHTQRFFGSPSLSVQG